MAAPRARRTGCCCARSSAARAIPTRWSSRTRSWSTRSICRADPAARHPRRAAARARLSLGARQRAARSRSPRADGRDRPRAGAAPRSLRDRQRLPRRRDSGLRRRRPRDSEAGGRMARGSARTTADRSQGALLSHVIALLLSSSVPCFAFGAFGSRPRPMRSDAPSVARRSSAAAADQGRRQGAARGLRRGRTVPSRHDRRERREARARDRRRRRVQRDLDRPGAARDRRTPDDHRVRPGACDASPPTTSARAGLADIVTVVPGDAFKEIPKLAGDVRLRVPRRLEARLQTVPRSGAAAARPARPLPRAQRRQQAERDARLPRRDQE